MLISRCIRAFPCLTILIAAWLMASPARAYVVNFNGLVEFSNFQQYTEGPVQFNFGTNFPGEVNFGNPAPSLAIKSNGEGLNFGGRFIGGAAHYLSSFEVGPSAFEQSGPGFSVSGVFNGQALWTISGHPQLFGKIDLSRIFAPDGRALSTIEINGTGWSLTSRRATTPVCCVANYLDNIDLSLAPVPTTPSNVALPTGVSGGTFHFNVPTVVPRQLIFIDPIVAVGYDYVTGAGDPNFASVILPNIGDGLYTVEFFDGVRMRNESVLQGRLFSFGGTTVSSFRVMGIEVEAELDPNDPSAFVTGLMFAGSGSFTGTMTPLTVGTVPEPSHLSLLFAGLLVVGAATRRSWANPQLAFHQANV